MFQFSLKSLLVMMFLFALGYSSLPSNQVRSGPITRITKRSEWDATIKHG